jgi:glycosyltransferase involved in cell wall biosynthesis
VLAQTFRDYHLVLVDDGSRDGTAALARRLAQNQPRITVVELPENRGRCFARNRGAEATRGPYVAFLDQDDAYHPDFLRATADLLARRPELDAAKVLPDVTVEVDPVRYGMVANSLATTMLLRRPAFEFIGGWAEGAAFRQHPGGCEDIVLQKLFSYCFRTGVLQAKLYRYSWRPGNALDRFLSGSRVVDGRVIMAERCKEDEQVIREMQRLRARLRERVRAFVAERLGGGEASWPPATRPAGFARLEAGGAGR